VGIGAVDIIDSVSLNQTTINALPPEFFRRHRDLFRYHKLSVAPSPEGWQQLAIRVSGDRGLRRL
jgi:hypothetical protein